MKYTSALWNLYAKIVIWSRLNCSIIHVHVFSKVVTVKHEAPWATCLLQEKKFGKIFIYSKHTPPIPTIPLHKITVLMVTDIRTLLS